MNKLILILWILLSFNALHAEQEPIVCNSSFISSKEYATVQKGSPGYKLKEQCKREFVEESSHLSNDIDGAVSLGLIKEADVRNYSTKSESYPCDKIDSKSFEKNVNKVHKIGLIFDEIGESIRRLIQDSYTFIGKEKPLFGKRSVNRVRYAANPSSRNKLEYYKWTEYYDDLSIKDHHDNYFYKKEFDVGPSLIRKCMKVTVIEINNVGAIGQTEVFGNTRQDGRAEKQENSNPIPNTPLRNSLPL